jgi:hypothetical protein
LVLHTWNSSYLGGVRSTWVQELKTSLGNTVRPHLKKRSGTEMDCCRVNCTGKGCGGNTEEKEINVNQVVKGRMRTRFILLMTLCCQSNLFFCGTGVWIQGLMLGTHSTAWNPPPALFVCSVFEIMALRTICLG